jgi:hypothetical protein
MHKMLQIPLERSRLMIKFLDGLKRTESKEEVDARANGL